VSRSHDSHSASLRGRRSPSPTTARHAVARVALAAALAATLGIAVLLGVGASPAAAPAAASSATAKAKAARASVADAVVVTPRSYARADALIGALRGAGVRVDVVTLPRTALARVTPAAAKRLRARGFAVLRAGAAPPPASGAPVRTALAVLGTLTERAAAVAAGGRPMVPRDLRPLTGDLRGPGGAVDGIGSGPTSATSPASSASAGGSPIVSGLSQTTPAPASASLGERLGYLPTATAPAAFAAGSVAVSVIFPESSGASSSRDWSTVDPGLPGLTTDPAYPGFTPRQVYIMQHVWLSLDWWAARNAGAHLTFVVPSDGTLGAPQQVDVSKEPIAIDSMSDATWRDPIMKTLGFTGTVGDTPPPETSYDDAVRKAAGTDWAFTLYCVDDLKVVNNVNVSSGMFPDFSFAYTFYTPAYHSPYVVTTWDNDGYGPGLYDGVLAHEMGHVFGALDEYDGGPGYPSTGDLYAGYLWVKNRNAVVGGTIRDRYCIMRGGQDGIDGYEGVDVNGNPLAPSKQICAASKGQIGWRDTDGDGIPDVIDTTALLSLGHPTATTDTATVTGTAAEKPWPHGHNASGQEYTRDLSVLVPSSLDYQVDGGAWTAFLPSDGSFGQASETFSLTTPSLGAGPDPQAPTRHVVKVRVSDADPHASVIIGPQATASVVAWVGSTPVDLALTTSAPAIKVGQRVTVTAAATSGGYPIAWLPGLQLGPLGGLAPTVTTGAKGTVVKTYKPSHTTTWQLSFVGGGQFQAASADAQATVGVRARLTLKLSGPTAARKVFVSGRLLPGRAGVPLTLQRSTRTGWASIVTRRTSDQSTYSFTFRPSRAGAYRLRVRFAGDALNLPATAFATPVVVH